MEVCNELCWLSFLLGDDYLREGVEEDRVTVRVTGWRRGVGTKRGVIEMTMRNRFRRNPSCISCGCR